MDFLKYKKNIFVDIMVITILFAWKYITVSKTVVPHMPVL